MSKLPKILLFSIIFFKIFLVSNALEKDREKECWSPANLGTANEEVIVLGEPQPNNGGCTYTLPFNNSSLDYSPGDATTSKNFMCAVGKRCKYEGWNVPASVRADEKIYFYALSSNGFLTGSLTLDSGRWSDTGGLGRNTAYPTLADCQSAHPKRVIGWKENNATVTGAVVGTLFGPIGTVVGLLLGNQFDGYYPTPYANLAECKNDLPPSQFQCAIEQNNHFIIRGGGVNLDLTPEQARERSANIAKCINKGQTEQNCINTEYGANGLTNKGFFKCNCETSFTCNITTWIGCSTTCRLNATGGFNFADTEPVQPKSPLLLIKVISNFMFYAAIFIFAFNMLLIGLKYIRSSGEPDKLKEVNEKLTNNITGLIFILLIGALLAYVVGIIDSAITGR